MIGSLRGTILHMHMGEMLLDVQGVGYNVAIPVSLYDKKVGTELFVYTHLHVKEEALDLFGFESYDDLLLFEKLLTVSGIGPKTALGVFSVGSRGEIVHALESGDVDFFVRVPRLGKKNVQKMIVELKGKIDLSESSATGSDRDVVDALIGFGFSEREARDAVKLIEPSVTDTSAKIKIALKSLGR